MYRMESRSIARSEYWIMKNKRNKNVKRILLVIAASILILFVSAVGLIIHYLGKVNYDRGTNVTVMASESADAALEEGMEKDKNVTISAAEMFTEAEDILDEEEVDSSETDSHPDEIAQLDEEMKENIRAAEEALYSKDVFNVLLIGSDARKKNEASRSDSMILVSINKKTNKIHLTSIMRDIYVTIPGYKNNRINVAYAYGGADLLFKTLKQNFGIQVDKYIAVDFYSFMDIIDTLGGVDMEISNAEVRVMNDYIKHLNGLKNRSEETYLISEGGNLHLNGTQALAYSRVRYVGNGDFERTNRQRKVLNEVFEKAKQSDFATLKNLADSILPQITTNLNEVELLSLVLKLPSWLKYDLESHRIPVDGSYQSMRVRGMAVLGVDFAKNKKYLEEVIYPVSR